MKITSEGIKSFLRVRPLKANEEAVLQTTDNTVVVRQKQTFAFDHVFSQKDSNCAIFERTAACMIDNSITGFNSCILAYGQTSSGKTFTMKGQQDDPGLIPLSVRRLFQKLSSTDDAYQVKVSYFEIYNQFIIDLLSDKSSNLDIREDINKNITIVDLTEQEVKSEKDALHIFEQGQMRRKFASTASNINSSRSHTIFRLELTIVRKKDFYRTFSYINMVDLAGSEGVSKTRAEGAQKRQGDNINKSLLALSNVIRQLSQKVEYVNFRDSKLTRILQSSLVTNSKSVVICTVFPTAENLQQTLNTLKFGTCVNKIKVSSKVNMVDTGSRKYAMSTPDKARSKSKKKTKQIIFQDIDMMEQSVADDLKLQNQSLKRELDEYKYANQQLKNQIGSLDLLLKGANKQLKHYQLQKQDYRDSMTNTMRIKDESIAYLNKDIKHLQQTVKFWQDKCERYAQKQHSFVKQINCFKDTIQKYEIQIKELRKALNESLEEGLDQLSKHSVRKNNSKRPIFGNKENNIISKLSKDQEEDMTSSKDAYPKKGKYRQILENMRKRPEAIDPMKLESIVRLSAKVFRLNTCLCQCIKQLTEMDQENQALHRTIEQKQKRIQQLERGTMSSSKKLDQNGKSQVRQLKRKIENLKAQIKMAKKRQRRLNQHIKRMNDANVRNFQGYQQFIDWKTHQAKKQDQQWNMNVGSEQAYQIEEDQKI